MLTFCSKCGNEETSDKNYCSKCGFSFSTNTADDGTSGKRKIRSRWWYLLPIFFSIVGGIIAYFILKDDDKRLAKNCLYLGIILTAIGIAVSLVTGLWFGYSEYSRM